MGNLLNIRSIKSTITESTITESTISIIQTPTFKENADKYFTQLEIRELERCLVRNPYMGKPESQHPELWTIDWGGERGAKKTRVIYIPPSERIDIPPSERIDKELFIYLISAGPLNRENKFTNNETNQQRIRTLLKYLAKFGVGLTIKRLWDLFKDGW